MRFTLQLEETTTTCLDARYDGETSYAITDHGCLSMEVVPGDFDKLLRSEKECVGLFAGKIAAKILEVIKDPNDVFQLDTCPSGMSISIHQINETVYGSIIRTCIKRPLPEALMIQISDKIVIALRARVAGEGVAGLGKIVKRPPHLTLVGK